MTTTLARSGRLMVTLVCALAAGACGGTTADTTDTALNGTQPASGTTKPGGVTKAPVTVASARTGTATARELIIPAGTTLSLTLTDAVASDSSELEDPVTAELTRAVVIDGRDAIPAGAKVQGRITGVDQGGRVKGRAMVAFRFTTVRIGSEQYPLQVSATTREAAATKGEDATKIGIGAGAGAALGGLLGGKKGAAEGAAIGGGAGTGVVLATRGKEIRLEPGTDVSTALTAPLTVRRIG